MTIEEFQQNIDALFPVKRKSDDFRADLDDILNEYFSLIQSFDDETKSKIGNNSTFVSWDNLEKRISSLIGGIKKCVTAYYSGEHHRAYDCILHQLEGYKSGISAILDSIELYRINAGEFLWRGRVFAQNRGKTRKDMFHIPFQERGIVKTQRYSATGYPCLYLGTSIHSCWEELGRPMFDSLMISGFRASKALKLLDIRRPQTDDFSEDRIIDLLLRLPLMFQQ